MNNIFIAYLLVVATVFSSVCSYGQGVNTAQPKIMVVPYTTHNENVLYKIENSKEYRDIIGVIGETFNERGFEPVSFEALYRNMKTQGIVDSENYQRSQDIIDEIKQQSEVDFYVRAEIEIKDKNSSSGSVVSVRLEATDLLSGSIANLYVKSLRNYSNLYAQRLRIALKGDTNRNNLEKFLNLMQESFNRVRESGRSIKLRVLIGEGVQLSLHDDINDNFDTVADVIQNWVADHSYKNYYKSSGANNNGDMLTFSEIKIPLMKDGKNYNISMFSKQLRVYILREIRPLTKLNFNAKALVNSGASVDIELFSR